MLNKSQISLIKKRIQQEGVKTAELAEDLLDHFCVAIEQQVAQGRPFQIAFDQVFATLQEDELKVTEMKTQELLEGKKTFYPDLFQSFGLLAIAFATSWLITQVIMAIAIGIEDAMVREQWLDQNYLWFLVASIVLSLGGAIGFAVWQIRQTQVSAPIFSFQSVPIHIYGVVTLIVVLSLFWLEPLHLFFPLFKEFWTEHISQLENFSLPIVLLATIFFRVLSELLFRGIILKGLLMTVTPHRAILWSSLFSALLLFQSFVAVFVLNIMLGWLYWKTRSLYPSIFFKVIAIVIGYCIFLFTDHSISSFLRFSWWDYVDHNLLIYLPLVIGSLLLTLGLLYYLNRRLKAESTV